MKGRRHAPNKIVRKHMGADPPLGEGKYLAGVPTCTSTWSRQSLHAALVARERIKSRSHRLSCLRSKSVKIGKVACKDAAMPRRNRRPQAAFEKSPNPRNGAFGEFPPKLWRLLPSRRPGSDLRAFCCLENEFPALELCRSGPQQPAQTRSALTRTCGILGGLNCNRGAGSGSGGRSHLASGGGRFGRMCHLLPVQVAQVEVDRHPADHRKQGDVDLASQMEVLLCQTDDALALEQVVAPLHPRPPGVLLAPFLRPPDRVLVLIGALVDRRDRRRQFAMSLRQDLTACRLTKAPLSNPWARTRP